MKMSSIRGTFWTADCHEKSTRRPKSDSNQSTGRLFQHTDWMWNPIASAPSGRNLELAVIDNDGVHALVFPCEKASIGWKNVVTGMRVDIRPTHWRAWNPEEYQGNSSQDPI